LFSGEGTFSCKLTGQFLVIVKPTGGILTLCEVQAYGFISPAEEIEIVIEQPEEVEAPVIQGDVPKPKNLLKGGQVSQSTTGWGGVPERAVDGNRSGIYKDKSVTHTKN